MGLKVFISSEMETLTDKNRRKSAKKAVKKAGHIPIMFEDFSGRPFEEYERSAIDPCVEEVKNSDLFLYIVNDELSSGMEVEYKTALNYLGQNKIFYYFKERVKRKPKVETLWSKKDKYGIFKEFRSNSQLEDSIIQSFAHYLKEKIKGEPHIVIDEDIKLLSGKEKHLRWWFEKGDKITITVIANGSVYAEFMEREKYIKRRGGAGFGMFDFNLGEDNPSHTKEWEIEKSDDYYLVLRASVLGPEKKINVRIVKSKV